MKPFAKKLMGAFCVVALLLSMAACQTKDPASSNDTPPASTPSTDTPSGTPDGSGSGNASSLLNGKTNEEKAIFLWNKMYDEDFDVSSYTTESTVSLVTQIMGYRMSADGTIKLRVVKGSDTTQPFYLQETVTRSQMGEGMDMVEFTETAKKGYADGKIFEYMSDDESKNGVYAAHSADEWETYYALTSGADETLAPTVEMGDCETVTFEWISEGYRVSFSGFTEEAMKAIGGALGEMMYLFDQDPIDVTMSATFRHDLLPIQMQLALVFDEGESASSFTMQADFKDFNNTEPITVNMSSYRDVGDLVAFAQIIDKQNQLIDAKSASYLFKSVTEVTDPNNVKDTVIETYDISSKNTEEGYSFVVEDSYGTRTTYANGVYEMDGFPMDMTDVEAKELLRMTVEPIALDAALLSHIEETEDGYCATLTSCDLSMFFDVLWQFDVTEEDIREIRVSYKNGEQGRFGTLTYSVTLRLYSVELGGVVHVSYTATTQHVTMTKA